MSSFVLIPGLEERLARTPEMKAACERGAKRVADVAQQIAPVGDPDEDPDPGSFRDSIRAEGTEVFSDDPAAAFIVFGTEHSPPHDTLRRAAEICGLHVR